jgi:hypothetical protein
MSLSRRTFLVAAGGASALVLAGGLWSVMQMPQDAAAPWAEAANAAAARDIDPRLRILRHAILAPNPHNRQPWRIRMDGVDAMTVWCDPDRRLPQTDINDRQITIGFGCFLETARLAALDLGFRLDISPFPDGEGHPRLDSRPVAHLRLAPDDSTPRDPLAAAILLRRSDKSDYALDRPLTAVAAEDLSAVVTLPDVQTGAVFDPETVAALRANVMKAIEIETHLARTHQESVSLTRFGASAVAAQPDGIALTGPTMEALRLTGLMNADRLADPDSFAFRSALDFQRSQIAATPSFVWVRSATRSRIAQLAAGRAYVRQNLQATLMGLSMHPVSQSLQEFPEIAATYQRTRDLLACPPGQDIQMLARIGFGAGAAPAPRWPLEAALAA